MIQQPSWRLCAEVEHSIPTYANNETKRARRGFWKRSRYPELERCQSHDEYLHFCTTT